MHNRHLGEQGGALFHQERQRRTASCNHEVRRTLPVLVPKEIARTLPLRLAGKAIHIHELAVKLDGPVGASGERRPNRLVRDEVGGQQPLVGVQNERPWLPQSEPPHR